MSPYTTSVILKFHQKDVHVDTWCQEGKRHVPVLRIAMEPKLEQFIISYNLFIEQVSSTGSGNLRTLRLHWMGSYFSSQKSSSLMLMTLTVR